MTPYYEEDGITIYHGDCRDYLPCLSVASVDLMITDPPYGIGWSGTLRRDDSPLGLIVGDDGSFNVTEMMRLRLRQRVLPLEVA